MSMKEEMLPKFLPTGSPQELAAFLRYRAEGHAHNPDIVLYAKPGQWAELAEPLEELAALRASAAPSDGMLQKAKDYILQFCDPIHAAQIVRDITTALPSDSRKAEPDAWQWRHRDAHVNASWSKWSFVEGTIEEFRDQWENQMRGDPTKAAVEVRPLYAALTPATEGGGREKIKPRRLFDEKRPDGYLESDNDWIENNKEAVVAFLERETSPSPSVGAPAQPSAEREDAAK